MNIFFLDNFSFIGARPCLKVVGVQRFCDEDSKDLIHRWPSHFSQGTGFSYLFFIVLLIFILKTLSLNRHSSNTLMTGDARMERILTAFIIYIGIFLFGMTVLKVGFAALGDQKMKIWIERATRSPIKGLVIGAALTAVLQSSSAVTVIIVGLAAAGLVRFSNTIGVILGANIGTTFTGLIASIPLGNFHLLLLVIGFGLIFFKKDKIFCLGAALIGLGCLFLAMDGFHHLSGPLQEIAPIKFILNNSNQSILSALGLGALFTAIIQSSSATTLIAMSFLNTDHLTLLSGIAIVIGANIGTCFTAILASFGSNKEARWVAYTHFFFNLFGTLLIVPFLIPFTHLLEGMGWLPSVTLAYSSLVFNVLTALVALPFAKSYGQWIERRLNF